MPSHLLETFPTIHWNTDVSPELQTKAVHSLEEGRIIFFPQLEFALDPEERRFLSLDYMDTKTKNISFNPHSLALKGACCNASEIDNMKQMIGRFAKHARGLIERLFPHYDNAIELGRTSFRPAQISDRKTSHLKNDTLLHVDAFPANPNQGRRILRVFTNVNPHGEDRIWKVGEPFEVVARQFLPSISKPWPGAHKLLHRLKLTKTRRTEYDHIMLQLHNRMKKNPSYQQHATQTELRFPPGSTWIVQTDHVSHAALKGQYVLEQTFYLPVSVMMNPKLSPLKILERLTERALT